MTKSSKLPSYSLDYINKSVLPALMKHSYSWPFIKAVDYINLKIPEYPKIIKDPMDFSKVKEKLRMKQYKSVNDCIIDISSIFTNCYLFNQPGEDVVFMAIKLHILFKDKLKMIPGDVSLFSKDVTSLMRSSTMNAKSCDIGNPLVSKRKLEEKNKLPNKITKVEFSKSFINDDNLDGNDFNKCMFIIKELMSSKYQKWNSLFLHPVDVERLNLFDYNDIIKKPMDLSTVKSKLTSKLYDSKEKFANEIELVFNNCIKYNGENSEFGITAKKFNEIFRDIYSSTFNNNKAFEMKPKLKNEVEKHSIFQELSKPKIKNEVEKHSIIQDASKPKVKNEVEKHSSIQETSKPKIKNDIDKHFAAQESYTTIPTKPALERICVPEGLDKKHLFELLFKIEKQQDELMQKSKKVQELMSVQNSEIEELYQKFVGFNDVEKNENNIEFGEAGSLMSESILSSSTSTNSRKSKRQIRPPKNQFDDLIDNTPQSLIGQKKSLSNNSVKPLFKESINGSDNTKKELNTPRVNKQEVSINKVKAKEVEELKPMSYDEKLQLSFNIKQLLSDKLDAVVEIIKTNEISLNDSGRDEMEIDFQTLQTKTLRALENLVNSFKTVPKLPSIAKKNIHNVCNSATTSNKNLNNVCNSSYTSNLDYNRVKQNTVFPSNNDLSNSHSSSSDSSSAGSDSDSSSSDSNHSNS